MHKTMCIAAVFSLAACEQREQTNTKAHSPEMVLTKAAPSMQSAGAKPASSSKIISLEEATGKFASAYLAKEHASNREFAMRNGEDPEDAYEYGAVKIALQRSYFNDGNDLYAVAVIDICEVDKCHTTTSSALVGVFRNHQEGWALTNSKVYSLYAEVEEMGPEGVTLKVTSYGPDDPHCCPTKSEQELLPLRPGR